MRKTAIALGVAVLLAGLRLAAQTPPETPRQSLAEQYLLAAANADRVSRGLTTLRIDPSLVRAATQHARQMAAHANISHQFPGEPELAQRASSAGARFSLVTENVAEAPNPSSIHDLWMHSAGHRANLLDPQVDSIGISVIARNGEFYAVEDFARSVQSLTLAQQEDAVGKLIVPSGIAVSPATEDARRTCALETGYSGTRRPWFVMRYTAADLSRLPDELQTRLGSGRYRQAIVGACTLNSATPFSGYSVAVLLYP